MGCTMTVGEQAMNIARNAALAAGFPDTVPGTTVDRQCGSAQQAVHFAAQAVMAGAMDVVIGAGVECMSRVPIGATTDPGPGEAYGPMYPQRYELIHQGECAEEIARRWNVSRDRHGRASPSSRTAGPRRPPTRAVSRTRSSPSRPATATGSSPRRARPWPRGCSTSTKGCAATPRSKSWPRCARPSPRTGTVTAGTSSQISDGAAAVLVMSEERAAALGLRPAGPLPHLRRGGQRPRRSC